MKSRLLVLIALVVSILIFCVSSSFAYYSFLSSEANEDLEILKEKFMEKEIILEKKNGIVWTVILPKNSGVITKEVKEEIVSTFLCFVGNSIVTYEDFLVMWKRAQSNIRANNPDGHSNIYTDTELISGGVKLSSGWIEGIGVWNIVIK